MAVANRNGLVAVIRLPEGEPGGRHCEVAPLRQIWGSVFCKLKTPGSLAVTREPNGKLSLFACNNHAHQVTKHSLGRRSFRASPSLGPDTGPTGILKDVSYPHGLRFTPDGRYLLVADAGNPLINVYDAKNGWRGSHAPLHKVTVLDGLTFVRGRKNLQEGGPKGLDIDRTGEIVATTCDERPLAFLPLTAILSGHAEFAVA